jgi:hypothetical protein
MGMIPLFQMLVGTGRLQIVSKLRLAGPSPLSVVQRHIASPDDCAFARGETRLFQYPAVDHFIFFESSEVFGS